MSVEVTEQPPPAAESDSDTPMLEIRNVTKTFGSVISLSDISTTVRAGKVTCVLGDNGAAWTWSTAPARTRTLQGCTAASRSATG